MANDLEKYFINQAGSGLPGFQGVRSQRGHGFFGRILSSAVYPLLRFFGKQALNTGLNIATDMIEDKKHWKESAKDRLMESKDEILKAGLARARKFQQEGKGIKRKRSYKSRSSAAKKGKKSRSSKKPKNPKKKPKKTTKKRTSRSSKSIKRNKQKGRGIDVLDRLMNNV